MKNHLLVIGLGCTLFSASSLFSQDDTFVTDRLGYTGTVVRYDTIADAQAGINSTDTIAIGNRDASIYHEESSWNVVMGSWWYSTDASGSAGWGNTTGNTGVGYMQLYDDDFSSVDSSAMGFGGWNGTHYTQATLEVNGSNAGAADAARFSAYDNVNDGGEWHDYSMKLTVGGLEGTETSPGSGWVTADNHPTSVLGGFNGLFELTENQTSPANQGFYTVDLSFNMTNWAWENKDDLTYPDSGFYDSLFEAGIGGVTPVPEPSAIAVLAMVGLGGILYFRRRKKK